MMNKMDNGLDKEVARLVGQESPLTTASISSKLNVNWAKVQNSLNELERKGIIKGNSSYGKEIWWVKLSNAV